MAMIKSGFSKGPLIVSKMIFVCKSCDNVEIVEEKDYSPDMEKKCSKCQNPMILESSNTDTVEPSVPNPIKE